MATVWLNHDVTTGEPVAFILGLPLNAEQAMAYMALADNEATPRETAILQSWLTEMTLRHGSWVAESISFD